MTEAELREKNILAIADMLRITDYKVEFKVKKKPAGVKVVIEVTREQLEEAIKKMMQPPMA